MNWAITLTPLQVGDLEKGMDVVYIDNSVGSLAFNTKLQHDPSDGYYIIHQGKTLYLEHYLMNTEEDGEFYVCFYHPEEYTG